MFSTDSFKKIARVFANMGMVGALSIIFVGCGGDVDIVKDGTFDDIEGVKIGDLFDKRFEDGEWSSSENELGQTIVTFIGTTKPYRANLPNEELTLRDLQGYAAILNIQTGDPYFSRDRFKDVKSWDDVAQVLWPVSQMTITFLITDKENQMFQLNTCDIPNWPMGCHGDQFRPYLVNGQ